MVAMMGTPTMRLVKHDDRRVFPRTEVHADVEGVRLDNTLPARQQPQLVLSLRDVSVGGLSAVSHVPLMRGERMQVNVPRKGSFGGWSAYGRVIRCEPSGFGYRVAMEFDALPAA